MASVSRPPPDRVLLDVETKATLGLRVRRHTQISNDLQGRHTSLTCDDKAINMDVTKSPVVPGCLTVVARCEPLEKGLPGGAAVP